MVEKRPFDGDEIFEVSSKLARQVEHCNNIFSSSELLFPEDCPHISHTSGGAAFIQINTGFEEKLASDTSTEQGSIGDVSGTGCISNSSWPTCSTSEEDSQSVIPTIHVPYFSEYYNPERPTRTMAHCAEIYSLLLDHPPRKPIPIGPNHQADVPAWGSQCIKKTSNHVGTSEIVLGSKDIVGDEDEKVLTGTCIIPMPDLGPSSLYHDHRVGKGRIDCLCDDGGSIRCVRQHIVRAREKLREYIGLERFVELGFLDMGEIVADKWSDGEEQLFHKIVYSNPVTLGKNFWDILSIAFPTRSKKEIVSYYFNVFMIQRRAEQNRCCPIDIDSDNDEWQGSDESGDNETGMSYDNEDSVVESPAFHDDAGYIQSQEDFNVYEKDEACKNENAVFVCGCSINSILETSSGKKLLNSSCSNLSSQLQENSPCDEKGDQGIQDDLCTSSEAGIVSQGAASHGAQAKSDKNDHWPSNFNEFSNGGVHEYVMEPCDAKVWDAGYTSCHQNKVELLPTCSMIEEVFGDGSYNCKARDK